MRKAPNFDTDFFALEILNRVDSRSTDNLVVTITVIVDQDNRVTGARSVHHHRIAISHTNGIDLLSGKSVHRRAIIKPFQFNIGIMLFKETFFVGNFPSRPTRPITVGDFQHRLLSIYRSGSNGNACQKNLFQIHIFLTFWISFHNTKSKRCAKTFKLPFFLQNRLFSGTYVFCNSSVAPHFVKDF